jgi:hypothetical protein
MDGNGVDRTVLLITHWTLDFIGPRGTRPFCITRSKGKMKKKKKNVEYAVSN